MFLKLSRMMVFATMPKATNLRKERCLKTVGAGLRMY